MPGALSVLLISQNGDASSVRDRLRTSAATVRVRHEPGVSPSLAALSDTAWDVVLADVDHLQGDAIDIVRRCVSASGECPVIVLADPSTLHAAEASLRFGATEVIEKERLTPRLATHLLRWAAEKKQIQRQLCERSEWLQSVTTQVSDGLFRSTPSGGFVYASPPLVDLLGYETEEALSRTPPDEVFADPNEWERLIQTVHDQGEVNEMDFTFLRADGSPLRTLVSCTQIRGKEGAVEYLDGIVSTASERPKDRQLQLYKDALAHSYVPAALLTAHSQGNTSPPSLRIAYANEAFGLRSGRETETLRGTPFNRLPTLDSESLADVHSAIRNGVPWSGPIESVQADGSTISENWFFTPVRDEEGDSPYWLAVRHNDSPSPERPEPSERAQPPSEDAAELKTAILRNLNHEMRTPLTSINGFTQILKEELSASHTDIVDRIQSESKRLQETIESVVHLSQLEATDPSLDRDRVNLTSVVRTVRTKLRPKIEAERIRIDFTPPTDPVTAYTNRQAVHRVMANLLENAVKFTPDGGRVELRIYPSRTAETKTAVFEVEDTGIGIDEDFLPHLFDPFTQESQGLTREYDGLGLGLALVDQLVDLLGGTIDVDSEKGTGSRFSVHLPTEPSERNL